MPKVEKAIHLDAFKLYMQFGMMSKEFLRKFEKQTGKAGKTAYSWEKDFNWKERAKEPIDEAIEELKETDKLNAEELISGLLDLCRNRMAGLETQSGYFKAIFGTAFERIVTPDNPNPENPIVVNSIADLRELTLAQSRLIRDEQGYMRLLLTLVGEPEKIMEERMIVQFVGAPKGFYDDSEGEAL